MANGTITEQITLANGTLQVGSEGLSAALGQLCESCANPRRQPLENLCPSTRLNADMSDQCPTGVPQWRSHNQHLARQP